MKIPSPKFARSAARLGEMLEKQLSGRRFIILTDETAGSLCVPQLLESMSDNQPIDIIEVDSGEACKQYEVAVELWKHLLDLQITRYDVVICVGGGAITDLGGFIASTYKRGMPFIFIPTTLMAMTDAAIGGKNGIDLLDIKNAIGTINQPEALFIFKPFLESLPHRQYLSGMAEVIKHGVICGGELWQGLNELPWRDGNLPDSVLKSSINTKLKIVRADVYETGLRSTLNFGHTIGHAIESCFMASNEPIEHGLAVANGMLIESTLAAEMGLLSTRDLNSITSLILKLIGTQELQLPVWTAVHPFLSHDKKSTHHELIMALPKGIGAVIPKVVVSKELLNDVYDRFVIV
jgi:3-dehydroquinate synthase